MSPRAAWRLETLGFTEVYDYAAGKADWFARGLPIEGERAGIPRIGAVARADVPTCSLDEGAADFAHRVKAEGWDTCIVVKDGAIVLGRLFSSELDAASDDPVEQVMRSVPSTFRPNVTVQEMVGFMDDRGISTALVTTSEGRLVGLLRRTDAGEA
jgi:predicted transcriptional regulator